MKEKMWRIRRQDFPRVFVRNGSIYWLRSKNIKCGVLMGHSSVPYEMDAQFSINIDTEFDFTLAKLISEKLWVRTFYICAKAA